jgi:hypothetical protein
LSMRVSPAIRARIWGAVPLAILFRLALEVW